MNNKIRIGVLGCASIAKRLVIPNIINTNKFTVTAFASRSIEKAKEFSDLFGGEPIKGYDNLLKNNNIDAIYIPLPTGMHYEWIMKSLHARKHVFCEKSIATNLKEVSEIIRVAKQNKLCVFENFMFPYHSQFEFVSKKLNEGCIGDLKLLRSSFGFPKFDIDNNIRYSKDLGGGALLDAGAYTLMATQYFLGDKQKVLMATSGFEPGFDVDFYGSIVLKNKNNVISQLAFGFDNFYQNNIELWGSKGKIVIERAFTAAPGYSPKVTIENHNINQSFTLPADNHFIKILEKFHQSISDRNFSFMYDQILSQANLIQSCIKKIEIK